MSTNTPWTGNESPAPLQPRPFLTPATRTLLLLWLILIVAGYFAYSWERAGSDALRKDLAATQSTVSGLRNDFEAGNPQFRNDLQGLREDSQSLINRLEQLESSVGTYDGKFRLLNERASEAESELAVERAKVAVLSTQATTARDRLNTIKQYQADWTARHLSLMTGDPGRRIAGSARHLQLVQEVLEKPRPTPDEIVQWEVQLAALSGPVEAALQNQETHISITEEHARMLSELSQTLIRTTAIFEQQLQLLTSLSNEAETLPPHQETLEEVLQQQHDADAAAETERLLAIRKQAREESEKEQAEIVAQLEKDLVAAKSIREQEKLIAERKREEDLAKLEREQIAEEGRVREAERRATIAGLQEEARRLDDALKLAQLEREFDRDLSSIKGYLSAFTEPGFKHRSNQTKGPVSLALLRGEGALEGTRPGMEKLMRLASDNDRPRGAIPSYIGGDNGWAITEKAPIERAQELLTKYGDLMVQKGLLAP